MSQRLKHCPNLNLENAVCEKYISRLLQKEKFGAPTVKPTTVTTNPHKRVIKQSTISSIPANQNQMIKVRPNVKQQNLPSPRSTESPSNDVLKYNDDSALVEVTFKAAKPRQRSKSTVANREPWGQLLKQHRSGDKVSMFSNFDPLRTLHFLAKELQHHLQSILPADDSIQQIVADMQYSLKRIPPEVASLVHLQQAIDLLPDKKAVRTIYESDKPEKLHSYTLDKMIQTDPSLEDMEAKKLQKVMEESTLKLEISCRQMESLCEQLKNDKQFLEAQLKVERDGVEYLKKKLEDFEFENNDILKPKIKTLEEEKQKLEAERKELLLRIETRSSVDAHELKSTLTELKESKSVIESECNKLKHQLRLSALEKEKYIAVLAIRDRQINEIRSEMTQLQEVVNEQLMELHNNAFASMPSNTNIAEKAGVAWNADQNNEHIGDIGDVTLSSIHTSEDQLQQFFMNKPNNLYRDVPCGDTLRDVEQENVFRRNNGYSAKEHKTQHPTEGPDSQDSIKCMFNELKKTAYEIVGTPQNHN